ncbi:unnamed protein product [Calypogeia fissa]
MEVPDRKIPSVLPSAGPRVSLRGSRLRTAAVFGEFSTLVPFRTQTTSTQSAASAIEDNPEVGGRGIGLGGYRQDTLQIQGSNNQMPQAERNNASCAAEAARRPQFEAPTWRHFAGDWR